MDKFDIKSLTAEQKETRRRILKIIFQRNLSHIGSCLSSVDLIDAVYRVKKANDKFVLSNGHAGIALYVVLEKNGLIRSPHIIRNLHIHPDRDPKIGIDVSTGSLGQGLPIALGMALANNNESVYCLISDGECAEGSIWETLGVAKENKINNLKIMVNANGWSAYNSIHFPDLIKKLKGFGFMVKTINGHDMESILKTLNFPLEEKPVIIFAKTWVDQLPFLKGLDAHYYTLTKGDYRKALALLK